MLGQALRVEVGSLSSSCETKRFIESALLALLAAGPALAGCCGASDMFVRSAVEGCGLVFAFRPGVHPERFDRNAAADARTSRSTPEDLVSADGACPGMAPPRHGDANALADGAAGAPPPSTTGTVALGHTECDVVRGIGAPDNVNLSNNPRGDRVAVVNYSRGPARRHLHLHGGTPDLDRARRRAGGAAESGKPKPKKKPADVTCRDLVSIAFSAEARALGLDPAISRPLRHIANWPPAILPRRAAARFRRRRAPC